jgi:hypothetical protein
LQAILDILRTPPHQQRSRRPDNLTDGLAWLWLE